MIKILDKVRTGLFNLVKNKSSDREDIFKKEKQQKDKSEFMFFARRKDNKSGLDYSEPYLDILSQLNCDNIDLRTFAIDALSKIASQNSYCEDLIIKEIANFILRRSKDVETGDCPNDIAMGLKAIGRRTLDCSSRLKVDLSGAYLKSAQIENGNFRGVNFSKANLSHAVFIGEKEEEGVFHISNFSECDFSGANLSFSRFMDVDFKRSDFSSANLNEMRVVRSNCSSTIFRKSLLKNAVFMESNFENADFRNVDVSKVRNLSTSHLENIKKNKKTKFPWGVSV
jgi:uncharacterized protein YjbI with pentapeptide repeats